MLHTCGFSPSGLFRQVAGSRCCYGKAHTSTGGRYRVTMGDQESRSIDSGFRIGVLAGGKGRILSYLEITKQRESPVSARHRIPCLF